MVKNTRSKVVEEDCLLEENQNKNLTNIKVSKTKQTSPSKRKAVEQISVPNSITVYIRAFKIETPQEGVTIYKYIGSNGTDELQMITYDEAVHNAIQDSSPVVLIENYRVTRIPMQFRQYRYCDTIYEYNLDGSSISTSPITIVPNLKFPLPFESVVRFGKVNKISNNIPNIRTNEMYNNVILLTDNETSKAIRIRNTVIVNRNIQIGEVISFRQLWNTDPNRDEFYTLRSWLLPPTPNEIEAMKDIDEFKCDVTSVGELLNTLRDLPLSQTLVFSLQNVEIQEVDSNIFYYKDINTLLRVRFYRSSQTFNLDDGKEVARDNVKPHLKYKFYLVQNNQELEVILFGDDAEKVLGITAEQAFTQTEEINLFIGRRVNFRGYVFKTSRMNVIKAINFKLV